MGKNYLPLINPHSSAGKLKERTLTLDKVIARTNPNLNKAISKAIDDADKAKVLVKQGIDPTVYKRTEKAKTSESQLLTTDSFFNSWIPGISVAAQWSKKHLKDMQSKYQLSENQIVFSRFQYQ